jgi:copper resistance protein B
VNAAYAWAAAAGATLILSGVTQAQEHEHHPPEHTTTPPAENPQHAGHQDAPAQDATTAGPSQSEREHVPPDPPAHAMHDMPYKQMAEMMAMDDTDPYGKVLFDELDWRAAEGADALAWDAQAFYGTDYNKLWFKADGERVGGTTEEARTELLWDRIFSRWWSTQAGVRHDFNEGPSRNWIALGVQGLAPYFFELEATAYFGEAGRTAARLSAEYEILFTQRLILQPEAELNFYGKDDPENAIASGFSDFELGLRLRYEIRREIAPYVGIAWVRHLGDTADLIRASGEDASDLQALAGIRFWF